jgi:hypothetical protein
MGIKGIKLFERKKEAVMKANGGHSQTGCSAGRTGSEMFGQYFVRTQFFVDTTAATIRGMVRTCVFLGQISWRQGNLFFLTIPPTNLDRYHFLPYQTEVRTHGRLSQ